MAATCHFLELQEFSARKLLSSPLPPTVRKVALGVSLRVVFIGQWTWAWGWDFEGEGGKQVPAQPNQLSSSTPGVVGPAKPVNGSEDLLQCCP